MTNADKIDDIVRGLEAYKTHGPDAFPLGVLAMLGKLMSDLGEACTAAAKRKAMEQLEASNTTCVMIEGGVQFEYDPTGDEPDVRLTFLDAARQEVPDAVPIGEAQWDGTDGKRHWFVMYRDEPRGHTACGKRLELHERSAPHSSVLMRDDNPDNITCPTCCAMGMMQSRSEWRKNREETAIHNAEIEK